MKKIIYVAVFMMALMVAFSCSTKTAQSDTNVDTTAVDSVQVDTTVVDSTVCLD